MHTPEKKLSEMPSNSKFGWLFSGIFLAAFLYFQLEHAVSLSLLCGSLALFFVLATVLAPSRLDPLNRAWLSLSLFLGRVVSPIVLSIIFFVLIVPVALITRLFGRDVLLLKKRQVPSYWVDKESIEPESFKNQF